MQQATRTRILICNAGSSSIKFGLVELGRDQLVAEAEVDWTAELASLKVRCGGLPEVQQRLTLRNHGGAVARVLSELQSGSSATLRGPDEIAAVGHRVVHGGERYTSAVSITPEVLT